MKPATAVCSGLAVAILSGVAGFQMGRRSADLGAVSSRDPQTPVPLRASPDKRATIRRPDLDELVRKLDAESDALLRFSTALRNMEAWVDADPAGALAWLSRQPVTARRNEVIHLALGQWAEQSPADAAAWASGHLNGIDRKNMLIRIAELWARSEPDSAARWFAGMQDQTARAGPLEGLFFLWGGQDAQAARAFLAGNVIANDDRAIVTQAMLAGWAKSDPEGASSFSLETSRRTGHPALFANTLANWATVDVASSAAWLEQHAPTGPERAAAIPELAGMFAHHDPSSGLAWIERLPSGDRPAALNSLAGAWAREDPAAAAHWLAGPSEPTALIGPEHVAAIVIGFLAADQPAFEKWKNSLPPGPLKDQAEQLAKPSGES